MTGFREQAPGGGAQGIFYGWYIVAAAFVVLAVGSGFGFYNLGVYLKAFVDERNFAVSVTSVATASFFISSGLTGLLVGLFIERHDPRWSVLAGALLCSSALIGIRWVEELWQLYAFHVVFGAGYAACALLPCTTLVARWFEAKRSIALSYASTGLSVGGILFTPVSVKFIEWGGLGWAAGWISLFLFIGIVPIALLVFRPSPASMGLKPDGGEAVRNEDGLIDTPVPDGVDFAEAVRSRLYLFIVTGFVFVMMAQVGTLAHQFRLVFSRTDSDETAALAIASMAGASIVGRLVGGHALTWMPAKPFVFGLAIAQAIALALYAYMTNPLALIATSVLFGITIGNLLMMQPLMIAEAFGLKAYGRLFSWSQFSMTAGVAAGPALIGYIYELGGGYTPAFLLMTGASLIGLICFLAAGPLNQFKSEDKVGV